MFMGTVLGQLAAFGISCMLGNLVYGIDATDPLTFVGVPLLPGFVALLANLIPAMRAIRLDPATLLRGDLTLGRIEGTSWQRLNRRSPFPSWLGPGPAGSSGEIHVSGRG
jgi:hypothetical protein